MGIYRQWKAAGENNANDTEGICQQVKRLKSLCENIRKVCDTSKKFILGGDLNMDKCTANDPLSRPELRALCPIWDKCILENNLTQINFKNTWHMPGKRSSLLDLYLSSNNRQGHKCDKYNV